MLENVVVHCICIYIEMILPNGMHSADNWLFDDQFNFYVRVLIDKLLYNMPWS